MTNPTHPLSDEQIEEIQGKAYRDLVAEGYTGRMGSLQWDRASARAIEAATASKYAERIQALEQDVHNLNWALGTDGYETMATPEQQAEADKAHAETMARIEGMKKRKDVFEAMEARIAEQALQLLSAQAQAQENHERAERLEAELAAAKADAGRYEVLIRLFGVTKLPCLLEPVVGSYVADGKQSIDAAIDAMRKGGHP